MAKKCSNPNCLYTNSDSSHYCVKCGHPLDERNWMDLVTKVRPRDKVKIDDATKKEYTVVNKDEYNALIEACNESDKKINDLNRRLRLSNRSWYEKLKEKLKKWWDDSGEMYFWLAFIIFGFAGFVLMLVDACESNDGKENEKEAIAIKQDNNSKKYGLYDNKRDSLIVPCEYDSIHHRKGNDFQGVYRNYFYLYKNGKIGVADSTGKISINCELDATEGAYNGVIILQKGDKQGLMDCYGHQIIPCEYKYVLWQSKPRITLGTPGTYVGRIIPVKRDNNSGWELYNRKGRKIRGQHYRLATQTGNPSLIKVVEDRRDYKYLYGIVDESGQIVIPCKYYNMSTFYNDRAWVKEKYNDSWSLIDTKGERIITLAKDYTPKSFSEGLSAIQYKKKVGFCDTSGKFVIPMDYELTMIKENEYHNPSFYGGKARVSYNGVAGYIDKYGKFTAEDSANKQYGDKAL